MKTPRALAPLLTLTLALGSTAQEPADDLCKAAASGQIETIKALLAKAGSPNQQCDDGQSPLIKAAGTNVVEVVKLLIAKGAKVDQHGGPNQFGMEWTPLMA